MYYNIINLNLAIKLHSIGMKKTLFFFALIIFFNNISYSSDTDSGLVAYYPFSGNTKDESGNLHPLFLLIILKLTASKIKVRDSYEFHESTRII